MKKLAAGATILLLLGAACQSEPPTSDASSPSPSPSSAASSIDAPSPTLSTTPQRLRKNRPPEVIVMGEKTVSLPAWSYCYGNRCVSGGPGSNPPDIGGSDQALIAFPLSGWRFDATFSPAGKRCGRVQHVRLDESGDRQFILAPHGLAETYDVTLAGEGEEGSLVTTFRWTTPVDGPLPEPEARLAVLADGENGDETSYGIELAVDSLATTPKRAKARVTVTSHQGDSITFRPKLTRQRFCRPEGSLYFDRPDEPGTAATQMPGGRPFTYEVTLVLDGERYRARARWPQGQIPGNHPSVRLRFSPPLPAVSSP